MLAYVSFVSKQFYKSTSELSLSSALLNKFKASNLFTFALCLLVAECPSSAKSFSFLFEKTNKPALMICRAAHDDTADYISLDHEQNGF